MSDNKKVAERLIRWGEPLPDELTDEEVELYRYLGRGLYLTVTHKLSLSEDNT